MEANQGRAAALPRRPTKSGARRLSKADTAKRTDRALRRGDDVIMEIVAIDWKRHNAVFMPTWKDSHAGLIVTRCQTRAAQLRLAAVALRRLADDVAAEERGLREVLP